MFLAALTKRLFISRLALKQLFNMVCLFYLILLVSWILSGSPIFILQRHPFSPGIRLDHPLTTLSSPSCERQGLLQKLLTSTRVPQGHRHLPAASKRKPPVLQVYAYGSKRKPLGTTTHRVSWVPFGWPIAMLGKQPNTTFGVSLQRFLLLPTALWASPMSWRSWYKPRAEIRVLFALKSNNTIWCNANGI